MLVSSQTAAASTHIEAPQARKLYAALRWASARACAGVRCPSRSMSHWVLWRAMNSAMIWRASSRL